jgi:hypothetical protein
VAVWDFMPKGKHKNHIRGKEHYMYRTYDEEFIDKVKHLYYKKEMTQVEVGKELDVSAKVIFTMMKKLNLPRRRQIKRNQFGPNNSSWKGDEAGYKALHLRVITQKGQPNLCQRCGRTDDRYKYEWANLTGNYADINDYERMCDSCHAKFDGVIENITKGGDVNV